MLKDVLVRMDLASAPSIALLLFFAVFVAVLAYVGRPGRRALHDRMNQLPLEGGEVRVGPAHAAATGADDGATEVR